MISTNWNITDNVYLSRKNIGNPIFFEYVSKYRRVTVVGAGLGYELRVHYKGIAAGQDWIRSYMNKDDAIAWAVAAMNNRDVIINSSLTIKEAIGERII